MNAHTIIFYIISAFILGTGLLSVTTRKIFRSAIWLLFSLIGIAGLFFWMDVQFIAAVQIVVYVGGIVVLIIFSIFLTQQSGNEMAQPSRIRIIASLFTVVFGFALTYMLISQYGFQTSNQPFNYDVNSIGIKMLSTGADGFALPFEVVSILLLASMIGAIVIAMRAKSVSGLKLEVSNSESLTTNSHKNISELNETSNFKSPTSN
ncbi:MAG: NADH-quinone oxidoreductase subunit J [Chitinophagales bacterium]